jgi:hypothetical protein
MTLTPSADVLLSAFDQVGNSNSHLLSARADGDLRRSFLAFIDNGDFQRELLISDRFRDWWNFHEIGPDCQPCPLEVRISSPSDFEFLDALTVSEFREALFQLLENGKSFYDRRLPSARSRELVEAFVDAHFPQDSANEIVPVRPDFLFQVSSDGDEETVTPFFENRGWDRCWIWKNGQTLLVMLLNGAP